MTTRYNQLLKTTFTVLLMGTVLFFSSCEKDEPTPTCGTPITWKLVEVLADPGDGSGTFQPVNSQKRLAFSDDGTVRANSGMCSMQNEPTPGNQGTFSVVGNYDSTSSLITPNCPALSYTLSYTINGNELIIIYPCIEACQERYIKL